MSDGKHVLRDSKTQILMELGRPALNVVDKGGLWTGRERHRISSGMNIGTRLFTFLHGTAVGTDAAGNRYFQDRKPRGHGLRQRRWVVYAGPEEATAIPPEWHAWIHHTTDAPLSDVGRKPWQKPHLPNLTGTPLAYRPPGHDYQGGHRAAATGDYEAWSPDA